MVIYICLNIFEGPSTKAYNRTVAQYKHYIKILIDLRLHAKIILFMIVWSVIRLLQYFISVKEEV